MTIAAAGFAIGFVACTHARSLADETGRAQYVEQAGDAPTDVQTGVRTTLSAFQDGYTKRDERQVDAFMESLFARDRDVLLEGTDADWAHGWLKARQLIAADWRNWGDMRLDTAHAVVWARGDVAWLSTVGVVHWGHNQRPLRFSAVLDRDGTQWRFRQIVYQWDERTPIARDVMDGATYRLLLNRVLRHLR